jgi:hypothetical protein
MIGKSTILAISIILILLSFSQLGFAQPVQSEYSILKDRLSSEVQQLSLNDTNFSWVSPPEIVLEAFNNILSIPGYYVLPNDTSLISSGNSFMITSNRGTLVGINSTVNELLLQTGNYTHLYLFNVSNEPEYNMTIGVWNFTLMPLGNNITADVETLAVFLSFEMIRPSSMDPIYGYAVGGTASTEYYELFEDGLFLPYNFTPGYTIFSASVIVWLWYYPNATSISYGYISFNASWVSLLPNPLITWLPLKWGGHNGVNVQDTKGFWHSYYLPGTGNTYWNNDTSYSDQNTTFTISSPSIEWTVPNTFVAIASVATSFYIPQLTSV